MGEPRKELCGLTRSPCDHCVKIACRFHSSAVDRHPAPAGPQLGGTQQKLFDPSTATYEQLMGEEPKWTQQAKAKRASK